MLPDLNFGGNRNTPNHQWGVLAGMVGVVAIDYFNPTDDVATVGKRVADSDLLRAAKRSIDPNSFGNKLGAGGMKNVFALKGGKAIGVPKTKDFYSAIYQEIDELNRFRALSIPTIQAELVRVGDVPAVLYGELYETTTKVPGWTSHMSDLTIETFNDVTQKLQKANLSHYDFQLGIQQNGNLLLVDPQGIKAWANHHQFKLMDEVMEDMGLAKGIDLFDQYEVFPLRNDPAFADWWGSYK